MNEPSYKTDHLEEYRGILTEHNTHSGRFKMELKLADNSVLEKSVEEIESSIELEFCYNLGISTLFFHSGDGLTNRYNTFSEFTAELNKLQVGDTFKISAALINGKISELPMRIQSFKDYEPLTAACTSELRLTDTEEGIKKKQELVDKRLKEEQELVTTREDEKKRAKWQKRKDSIKQYWGKDTNITKIIIIVVGTTIANQIPNLIKLVNIYLSFVSN